MNTSKLDFLKRELIINLKKISPNEPPRWGKMNPQQMIEHLSESIRIANGKIIKELVTPQDKLQKVYDFMMSDIPFKENTRNSQMGDFPDPIRNSSINEAMEEFEKELNLFFEVFEKNPGIRIMNPFFGNLNYEEWTHLFYKHATHHLKQFGIEI